MKNEEKADDICAKYGVSKLFPTEEECIAYNAAMEMAEWKDKENIEHSDIDFIKVCHYLLTKGIDLDMFDWREMSFKYKEYIKQQAMEE